MTDETRQLAQFVVDFRDHDIPADVRERAGYLILDAVANGYLGSRQSCFRMASSMVAGLGSNGASHVFGASKTLDASRASFLNGIAVHGFESDHTAYDTHPGSVVFPAVLALGEALGATGEAVMRALIIGYEVNIRVSAAQTHDAEVLRGFHNPSVTGPFGAAAGCSLLLGLSLDQTLAALGIAGSSSSGLMEWVFTGAMTKRLHLGRASQMGLESALLAREGMTGPPTILEGKYGFHQAFSPSPEIERLTDGLGSKFLFEEVRVRPYAGWSATQPFIPALNAWHERGIDPSRIEQVHIVTSAGGTAKHFQDAEPHGMLRAQYSLPYMTAVLLARGIDGMMDLSEADFDDRSLQELAARVTVAADDRFEGSPMIAGGELQITVDGTTETFEAPGVPMYSLEELRTLTPAKLERNSRGLVSPERVAQITEAVEGIEKLGSITALAELIFAQ